MKILEESTIPPYKNQKEILMPYKKSRFDKRKKKYKNPKQNKQGQKYKKTTGL
jgi:hypothetical protein